MIEIDSDWNPSGSNSRKLYQKRDAPVLKKKIDRIRSIRHVVEKGCNRLDVIRTKNTRITDILTNAD